MTQLRVTAVSWCVSVWCSVPVDSLPSVQGLQGEELLRRLLEMDVAKRPDLRTFDPQNLVHQIDRGDLLIVKQIVKDHPEKVVTTTGYRTGHGC